MKTIATVWMILFALNCLASDDRSIISDPRLPNGGGHAAKCLKSVLQPLLAEGQSFIAFSGPYSDSNKAVTDYELITRLPIAHYKLRFTTQDREGWQVYRYLQGDILQIGLLATAMARTAVVLLKQDASGAYEPLASVDLTPCEAQLKLGN